jgi:hypothetical protein
MNNVSPASTRPRDVALASVLTILGSVLALAGIFGVQGQLRSSGVRRQLEELLADQRFAPVDMSVDALLNLLGYGLMAAAAASVAAIVLAVFVMRGHNPSRIALTTLGGLVALLMLLSWPTGVVTAVFVGYTVSLLWRAPVRGWFAASPTGQGPGHRRAGGSPAYWEMSGSGAGGAGPAGDGRDGDAWPGPHGPEGEPEPSRNPDAVPDPDPHWPTDPVHPGAGPGPYPQPWPPEPGHEAPSPWRPEQTRPEETRPEHTQQQGQAPGQPPGQAWHPGYPGPTPTEQRPAYGYPPTYPSGAQGQPGPHGYPSGAGYPYSPGYYGYPPASGDPYRRQGQVVAAHVMTWIGAAFGLVTGLFFVAAASSQDIIDLVEEQLSAGGISQGEFTAILVAAGVVTLLWSLAVLVVSVLSWRGHNWAVILLTVMGGGYLLVQLFTLLSGQLPVLFTIVWVAAVLALLWWPASRQWYAARRGGQQAPPGPQGPYGPPGPGSPYPHSQPPRRNQPW